MTMMDYESYIHNLPVMPQVAARIMKINEENLTISFKDLEKIIMVDPFLSSKILKVANSALYARQKQITNLQTAITLLGFKTIKSLVLLVSASTMFRKYSRIPFHQTFWKHSLLTAFIAKDAAEQYGMKSIRDEIFLAGLLHDLGRVALFHSEPEAYSRLLEEQEAEGKATRELEQKYFNTDHKEVGGAILAHWNFPEILSSPAREHGMLHITSPHKNAVLLVTVADIIALEVTQGTVTEEKEDLLAAIVNLTPLTAEQITFYRDEFIRQIELEPFFGECVSLFNVA
ncbi:MAG: HDOD domain-containing protein [Spirochaetales bacterium]|nr:HDOD domain-containing protein [Spirochaetales bacterium]